MDLFDLNPPRNLPSALAWSFREARVLQVAVRLNLFTVLHEHPQGAARLASTLNSDPDMTERLLIVLASLDLVSHDKGYWRNKLAASLYFVKGTPLYQGDVIELAAEVWHRFTNLERIVRHGRKPEDQLFSMHQHSAWQTTYLKAMHGLASAGRAQRLARLIPLAGRRTLLDVKGAPGTYSLALCERFATLNVILLDDEQSVAQSRSIIKPFSYAQRITFKQQPNPLNTFGQNEYEALLLSHISVESESDVLNQLVKAHDALKSEGLLIIQTFLLENDLSGGEAAALAYLFDHLLTLEQMQSTLAEAGFERITVLYRDRQEGDILVAYKAADLSQESLQQLIDFAQPEKERFFTNGREEHETMYDPTLPSRILTFENEEKSL